MNNKVGILTAIRTNNNGTDLQAIAMVDIFKQMGVNAELINYRYEKHSTVVRLLFFPFSLTKVIRLPFSIYNEVNHRCFRKRFMARSSKIYTSKTISDIDYYCVVVGSDQIWNMDNMRGDINFFLPWKKNNQIKMSYAASFGKTNLSSWERKYQFCSLLKDFKGVSVREQSAVAGLKELGIVAREDLDPLLMARQDIFCKIAEKARNHYKPFVLLYLVEENEKAESFAISFAKKNNFSVIYPTYRIRPRADVLQKHYIGVERFVDLVINSSAVVTNSYHCMSLAIKFQKPLSVFLLNNQLESSKRMTDLAVKLEMESCIMHDDNDYICFEPNWEIIEKKINILRQKSFNYLEKVLDLV